MRSAFDWTLGAEVENLVLTGTAVRGTGNALGNRLYGNAAANTLDGAAGADVMAGGLGNDRYVVDDAADMVFERPDEGVDTIESSIDWTLRADVENLTLTGTANLAATGNVLDNVLTGNAGANLLRGGLGNDTYVVNRLDDQILEVWGEGSDTVRSSVSWTLDYACDDLVLTGTAAIDGTGNEFANRLTGNAAANRLDGGVGADRMSGGAGDDTYVVDDVGDVVGESAGAGIDTVQASTASWVLSAAVDNLILVGAGSLQGYGNDLANRLTGNDNANLLSGGLGADTMIGGAGNDTYIVDNLGDTVVEAAGGGTDTVKSSVSWTLDAATENLTLTGTAAASATGNAGANLLAGNTAANRLDGGAGADTMYGGAGNDTYVVDNTGDKLAEGAGNGIDTVEASVASWTLGLEIENLVLVGAGSFGWHRQRRGQPPDRQREQRILERRDGRRCHARRRG